MRLLVDAQCVQSTSSLRGIGRYALGLLRGLAETAGEHQMEVLLNGGDAPDRLLRARTALETFLPAGSIHVFEAPWPWTPPYDPARRPAAEAAYIAAVRSLCPDVLLVASPFESDDENVTSIGRSPQDPPTAAVLYDLIPALDPGTYLMGPGGDVYWRRYGTLEHCAALLAISQHSGRQAERLLGDRCPPVTPVWGGPYPSGDFPAFESRHDDLPNAALPERFLLSVGGDHPRKNLDRLVEAWSLVAPTLRARTPLVLACRLNPGTVRRLRRRAGRGGVSPEQLVLLGGVSEARLQQLYARADGFVFPSLEEGLGMPPLEAMAAGCPTLLARGSSLDELCDEPAAFFDGLDVTDAARAMTALLCDADLVAALRGAAAVSAQRFTWRRSAELSWAALLPLARTAPNAPDDLEQVPWSALETHTPARRPWAVVLDRALPDEPPGPLGLPVGAREQVAGASALLAADVASARTAVRAGLVDQAVVVGRAALAQVCAHDVLRPYADALTGLDLPPDVRDRVVETAARTPRWTLERPAPVWLLLSEDPAERALVERTADAGVDLVSARPSAAALASLVDVVLVPVNLLSAQDADLQVARRAGARVVALCSAGAEDVPAWCEVVSLPGPATAAASWSDLLPACAARWGRTTGWPWRDAPA